MAMGGGRKGRGVSVKKYVTLQQTVSHVSTIKKSIY